MKFGLFYFSLMAILFLNGCDSGESGSTAKATFEDWLSLRIHNTPVQAQLAITMPEKQRGLMYRKELPDNSGMLFVYERPQQVSFWMANTLLPLDLGLFDAGGILKEIHRLYPYDTASVRSRSAEIQFALEMEQGWFAANECFPGAQLDMDALREAIRQRGEDPGAYGLR